MGKSEASVLKQTYRIPFGEFTILCLHYFLVDLLIDTIIIVKAMNLYFCADEDEN